MNINENRSEYASSDKAPDPTLSIADNQEHVKALRLLAAGVLADGSSVDEPNVKKLKDQIKKNLEVITSSKDSGEVKDALKNLQSDLNQMKNISQQSQKNPTNTPELNQSIVDYQEKLSSLKNLAAGILEENSATDSDQVKGLKAQMTQSLDTLTSATEAKDIKEALATIQSASNQIGEVYQQSPGDPKLAAAGPPSSLSLFLDVSYAVALVQCTNEQARFMMKSEVEMTQTEIQERVLRFSELQGEVDDILAKAQTQADQTRQDAYVKIATAGAQLAVAGIALIPGNDPLSKEERQSMVDEDDIKNPVRPGMPDTRKFHGNISETPRTTWRAGAWMSSNTRQILGDVIQNSMQAYASLVIDAPATEQIGAYEADMAKRRARNEAAAATVQDLAQRIQAFHQQLDEIIRSLTDVLSKWRSSINLQSR